MVEADYLLSAIKEATGDSSWSISKSIIGKENFGWLIDWLIVKNHKDVQMMIIKKTDNKLYGSIYRNSSNNVELDICTHETLLQSLKTLYN